jgi:N-acetylglucosamine kinase-like BadF-type ATPase
VTEGQRRSHADEAAQATDVAVLAVDGGNSKTDVALVAADGALIGIRRGPTVSHQQVGLAAGADALAGIVAAVRDGAGLDRAGPPATVGAFGLAGADRRSDVRMLTAAFAARGLMADTVMVNDAFPPIRADTSRGWGVTLVCGSGINAAGVAPDGRSARMAALGPISGDWGGGGDVGRAGLGAAVRARDGRGPRTRLEALVPAHFRLTRPLDVTWAFELGRLDDDDMRSLSPVVFGAAAAGDAVALAIVDRLADELVTMGSAIIRRLGLVRRAPEVVLAGGVFAARDERFEGRIRDGIGTIARGATVRRATAPPVLGVALLGLDRLRATGAEVAPGADERIRAALTGWTASKTV